jgi:hypothetical protein
MPRMKEDTNLEFLRKLRDFLALGQINSRTELFKLEVFNPLTSDIVTAASPKTSVFDRLKAQSTKRHTEAYRIIFEGKKFIIYML